MITTGHLCSGYDGLGRGLLLAHEHRALWHAEVDLAASVVLGREHPGVPNVGDLTADIWHMAPHVDLLTAGFPCQPVSEIGLQKGDADHRWLWPACLSVIKSVRPSRIFIENVQRLATFDRGRLFRGLLDDLRTARYAVRWTILGACYVGAPHHRHRVFVVADRVRAGAVPAACRGDRKALCAAPRGSGRVLFPSPRAADAGRRGVEARRAERTRTGGTLHDAVGTLPLDGWGAFAEAVHRWEGITARPAPEPTAPGATGVRQLRAEFAEWMMGLPPGYLTETLSREEVLGLAGNGVVPLQAAAAYSLLTT